MFLESAQNLLAPGARGKRAIQRHAFARAFSVFAARAGARIPRRLMRAEEEHRAVGIENILRAVAVMDVPIGDQHPPDAMLALSVARRDRDGVEDAEAHAAHRRGMMARRPADGNGIGNPLLDDRIHGVQRSAGGAQRRIEGLRRNDGVAGRELMKSFEDLALGQLNVLRREWHKREFVVSGQAWRNRNQIQAVQRVRRPRRIAPAAQDARGPVICSLQTGSAASPVITSQILAVRTYPG